MVPDDAVLPVDDPPWLLDEYACNACIRSLAMVCDRSCRLLLSDVELDDELVELLGGGAGGGPAVPPVGWLEVPSSWLRMDCTSLVSCGSGSELLVLLVLVELSLAAVVLLLAELLPPDCSDTKAACKSLASFWNGFIPPEPACAPVDEDVFVLVESPVGGGPGGGPGGG